MTDFSLWTVGFLFTSYSSIHIILFSLFLTFHFVYLVMNVTDYLNFLVSFLLVLLWCLCTGLQVSSDIRATANHAAG